MSISNSFCSEKPKGSALDSLTLTPESTITKFFETVASLMSAVNGKDKKRYVFIPVSLYAITLRKFEVFLLFLITDI